MSLQCHTKRKLPGPIGLLLEGNITYKHKKLTKDSFYEAFDGEFANEVIRIKNEKECNKNLTEKDHHENDSQKILIENLWIAVINDLKEKYINIENFKKRFNCDGILRKFSLNNALTGRVPFLCVQICNLDIQYEELIVTLQDESGKVQGIIHSCVTENYEYMLNIGTVFVLHNTAILCSRGIWRQPYLNITLNTILTIYNWNEIDSVLHIECLKLYDNDTILQCISSSVKKNTLLTPHQENASHFECKPASIHTLNKCSEMESLQNSGSKFCDDNSSSIFSLHNKLTLNNSKEFKESSKFSSCSEYPDLDEDDMLLASFELI